MSIEKFLNEMECNEPAMEGIEGIAIIGFLLASVGLIVHSLKSEYDEYKRKNGIIANTKEFEREKEEFLRTHSVENEVTKIINDIRKMINEIKKNPEIIKKIEKSVASVEDYSEYKNAKVNSSFINKIIVFKIFEDLTYDSKGVKKHEKTFTVIDADQELNSSLGWITDDIIKAIKIKYSKVISLGLVKLGNGDGDEGILDIVYTSNEK